MHHCRIQWTLSSTRNKCRIKKRPCAAWRVLANRWRYSPSKCFSTIPYTSCSHWDWFTWLCEGWSTRLGYIFQVLHCYDNSIPIHDKSHGNIWLIMPTDLWTGLDIRPDSKWFNFSYIYKVRLLTIAEIKWFIYKPTLQEYVFMNDSHTSLYFYPF